MEVGLSENVVPEDGDYRTPDHLIIWLDAHIGDPGKYHHLKQAFSSNIDPRSQTWTMLTDRDYQNLIRANEAMAVSFGGILCLLLAYSDPNSCFTAIEKYKNKRILFISSGSLGKDIVPDIVNHHKEIFKDPITNNNHTAIYIFCGCIEKHIQWALPYVEYLLMFDHEADLLERITSDMSDYYFSKAGYEYRRDNLKDAYQYLGWSKKLLGQHQKLGGNCERRLHEIEEQMQAILNTVKLNTSKQQEQENPSEPCS